MPNDVLLQYGALGVMVLGAGLAVRVLFAREVAAHEREKQRADRMEAEVQRLNAVIQERMLPILHDATQVISEALHQEQGRDRR